MIAYDVKTFAAIARFHRALGPCCGNGLSLHGPFLDMNTAAFDGDIRRVTRKRYEECYEAARRSLELLLSKRE